MTHVIAILLCILGFACICAAMPRHQKDLLGRPLRPALTRPLRLSGSAMLLAALVIDMLGLGGGYGAVAWFGQLTLGTALVLFALHRLPAMRAKPRHPGKKSTRVRQKRAKLAESLDSVGRVP